MTLEWRPAREDEAEALADLRVAALREALEALGRFDPVRGRQRFLDGFVPAETRTLWHDGHRVGLVTVRRRTDHLWLDQLYLDPAETGRGLGSTALGQVKAEAQAAGLPIRLIALKGSRANGFYRRHGFRFIEALAWDNAYA